jgi:hypothetical protein
MLISEKYQKEQEQLHQNPNYGVASVTYAPMVTNLIDKFGVTELLDYGAGKGRLAQSITPDHALSICLYDPGVPELNVVPAPSEMVCCIDVLEHIEPEYLDSVLDDLKRVTQRIGFFTIHTGPAIKTLSDGRNAHLIQEDYTWWLPKLWERFNILSFNKDKHGFWVVVNDRNV